MAEHNDTGKWGEQEATDYLVSQGYAIVARNARLGTVEVDIIAMKDGDIIFAEVKTRSNEDEDPALAVDARKLSRLCRAADTYVRTYDIKADPRLDLLSITGTQEAGMQRLDHYKNIYLPGAPVSILELPDRD